MRFAVETWGWKCGWGSIIMCTFEENQGIEFWGRGGRVELTQGGRVGAG